MDKQKQIEEAIQRMEKMKILPQTIREFKNEGLISASESMSGKIHGILFWINEEEKEVVKKFEEKYKAVVYHAIRNETSFGKLLSLLYVSAHEEEWIDDNRDIIDGCPIVYVENLSDGTCSEFGRIGVESANGGLRRIS